MDLIQAKISEIKNLNLVYIYAIDSTFKEGSNKYVGAKVVFNKNQTFELDYRNPHFEELLKQIKNVYNLEKDDHIITLLGDYAKLLINGDYFNLENDQKNYQECVTYLSSKNMYLYKYQDLIFEVIYSILNFYKKYEILSIDNMQGYNNKWIINYHVGCVKKSIPVIIYLDDENNINFRVSFIDGMPVNIRAKISLNKTMIKSIWFNKNDNVNGEIEYHYDLNQIIYSIRADEQIIEKNIHNSYITEQEYQLIRVYETFLGIEHQQYLKIGLGTYISLIFDENRVSNDEIVYNFSRVMFNMNDKNVFYEKRSKNGISKYKNEVVVTLDEEIEGSTFLVIDDISYNYILVENYQTKYGNSLFSYEIIENNDRKKLNEVTQGMQIEPVRDVVNSLSDIKLLMRRKRD